MGKMAKLWHILLGIFLIGYAVLSFMLLYVGQLPFDKQTTLILAHYVLPIAAGITLSVGLYHLLRGLFSRRKYHGITKVQEDGAVYVTDKALSHAIRAAVEADAPDVLDTRVKLRIKNRKGVPEYSAKVRVRLHETSRNLDERGNYLREKIAADLVHMTGHPVKRIDIVFHQIPDKKKEGDVS